MPEIHRRRWRPSGARGGTSATPPQATTLPATTITNTSAFLNGAVNPEGASTSYWFAWGTTPQYGNVTVTGSAGSSSVPQTVGASLTGLTTGATYHYAVVAQGAAGTVYGADGVFVAVAPQVVTVASEPTVPYGTSVDVPRLRYPLHISTKGAAVAEQDSIEDVFSQVRLVVDCQPIGACPDLPGFGCPDLAFSAAPLDTGALTSAIQRWVPQAEESAVVSMLDDTGGSWRVALTTGLKTGTPTA